MASRFPPPFGRGSDPLLSIYREMNRMFDDVLGGTFGTGSRDGGGAVAATPRVDVHESGDDLVVTAELPGVRGADVDVRLDGDVLTLSGEKHSDHEQKQGNVHLTERSFGRFSRSVPLPFKPDADQVSAEFRDGVLTVRLRRSAQQPGGRRIEVRTGEGPSARQDDRGRSDATGEPREPQPGHSGQPSQAGQAGQAGQTGQAGPTGQAGATAYPSGETAHPAPPVQTGEPSPVGSGDRAAAAGATSPGRDANSGSAAAPPGVPCGL